MKSLITAAFAACLIFFTGSAIAQTAPSKGNQSSSTLKGSTAAPTVTASDTSSAPKNISISNQLTRWEASPDQSERTNGMGTHLDGSTEPEKTSTPKK